jgi:hypothetical protein
MVSTEKIHDMEAANVLFDIYVEIQAFGWVDQGPRTDLITKAIVDLVTTAYAVSPAELQNTAQLRAVCRQELSNWLGNKLLTHA